jgi:hypothetical protein
MPDSWEKRGFVIEAAGGISHAERDGMKLMQNSHNWVRALLPTAGLIMGQAKSPTYILPTRTEHSV